MIGISDAEFNLLSEYLEKLCGIAVPSEKRYLFMVRLAGFLEEAGCGSFAELYNQLTQRGDPLLRQRLVQAMTNHESTFFRDGHPFLAFRDEILPHVARESRANARVVSPRLRFLSCGCSAGQEPYSIAMCVHDWLGRQRAYASGDITILGFDVSGAILERARRGLYTTSELGQRLPDGYQEKYFSRSAHQWQVTPAISSMVQLIELNLVDELAYAGRFDVIFCRNVIIYFSQDLKKRILERLALMLQPWGVLILGASESVYKLSSRFRPVHHGQTIYYTAATAPGPTTVVSKTVSPKGDR